MMKSQMFEHCRTVAAPPAEGAHDRAQHRRSRSLRPSLLCALFVLALDGSAVARPGSGYGDLIDSYCIDRGRLRVRAHQGHCAMCHHLGTFDSAPEHRIEPNWTEFERGRAGAGFDFFCPGGSASSQMPMPAAPQQRATIEPAGPSVSPKTSPGAGAMGIPPDTGTPGTTQAPVAAAPDAGGPTATAPAEPPPTKPQSQSAVQVSPAELTSRLTTLHDTIGIKLGQEPAWREFIDAMATAAPREAIAPGATEPTARLRARERDLSERIAALRAAGTALSRLSKVLDETQRRALSDGVAPLLDNM